MQETAPRTAADRAPAGPAEVRIPVAGMTCASCVNRIERFLSRTPGVEEASVNLATEVATIRYLPDLAGRAELVGAIEAAGYEVKAGATYAAPLAGSAEADALAEAQEREDAERERELRRMLIQSVVSIAVALGIMAVMLWPQTVVAMETLNKLVLWPATFIQFWAGGRFYRAAWRAGRHGGATMDTLVVIGTTAAWAYSVFVTLFPEVLHDAGLHPETYFDSSAIIIGLVLLGRWLELRARGRTTGAIRRLLGLQATIGPDRRRRSLRRSRRRPRPGPARRPAQGPSRREGPGRWRHRRGRELARRVDADRRADPGREGDRRRGHRRDPQYHRLLRDAGDPRRSGDGPRPHRRDGRTRPGQQGPHPAACRSGERGLRAARPRHRWADLRDLVPCRSRATADPCLVRVHRRRRHRLPVCDGTRNADRDHGRDGARGRGWRPVSWWRGTRGGRRGRHGGLRQDRHADGRPAGGRRCRRRTRLDRGRGARSGVVGRARQ